MLKIFQGFLLSLRKIVLYVINYIGREPLIVTQLTQLRSDEFKMKFFDNLLQYYDNNKDLYFRRGTNKTKQR